MFASSDEGLRIFRGELMRLIHTGDIHLDSKQNTNFKGIKLKERKAELLNTFSKMIDYANENLVDGIIIAGDLFDSVNVSLTAKNVVKQAIITNPQITFYYLMGNHDEGGFLEEFESYPDNLKVFGSTWTEFKPSESVVISGIVLSEENKSTVYSSLVLNNSCINIVVMHGQIVAGQTGEYNCIDIVKLKNKGIDYLALGHIHSYRCESIDARGVYCYSGCLEGRGFDECGQHGFVVLDIDESSKKISSTFVSFAKREIIELKVDVTNLNETPEIIDKINESIIEAGLLEKDIIKIVLKGELDICAEKNIDLITKRFEDRFYHLVVSDETKLKVDPQSFSLDQSLKGEFVRMVLQAEDISKDEKIKIISCGIKAIGAME